MSTTQHYSFFKDQTVFLTGATGGLGGCILYKLALMLPTKKIYALCRSQEKAHRSWQESMPAHHKAIIDSGKVVLIEGDITKPSFGIDPAAINDVTVIINAAADISFAQGLEDAIQKNSLPPLELAKIALTLKNLVVFVQLSTAYCNTFLPDGLVEERIYSLGTDAEKELLDPVNADKFPWPYAYSKHLMERLLLGRYPNLPIIIIRPTIIGAAINQPFPLYGPIGSTPLESFFRFYAISPGNRIFHAAEGSTSGTNVFDEVPVDWVANLILLHAAAGTRGIVHAGAESYIPRTLDSLMETAAVNGSGMDVKFVTDRSIPQCHMAAFYKVATRDWRFSNKASAHFRTVEGPLSISVKGHDMLEHDRNRVQKMNVAIEQYKKKTRAKL